MVSTWEMGGHLDTIEPVGVRRRRRHSAEFKAKVLAACRQPGASRAGVALAHSINANLLRKWLAQAERGQQGTEPPKRIVAPSESFVALPLTRQPREGAPIRIEVRRGALAVSVQWPSSAIAECAIWLRELLK
jgi:transposase-like protein